MPSLTAIALGISVLTTGLVTLHDTLKQVQYAKGFMAYILTKDIHTNAQYALTCVTSAIQDRVAIRSEQIRRNLIGGIKGYVDGVVSGVKVEVDKKLQELGVAELVGLVREQQKNIIMDSKLQAQQTPRDMNQLHSYKDHDLTIDKHYKNTIKEVKGTEQSGTASSKVETREGGESLWQRVWTLKDLISNEINKELNNYTSVRKEHQKKAVLHLYELYKKENGIHNSKWLAPYNILMLLLLGVTSFFLPKLAIGLSITYLISTEIYLLSDLIETATGSKLYDDLLWDRVYQFYLTIIATSIGYNRYELYKENVDRATKLNRTMSANF